MNDEMLRSIHQRSSHAAKEILVRERGPGDVGIRVMVSFEDGCSYGGHPGPTSAEMAGEDALYMWRLMATSIGLLYTNHNRTPVEMVFVTCEGYMKMKETDDPDTTLRETEYSRGDFERDFATNIDTDIKEVLMTHVLAGDSVGEPWIGSVVEAYSYDDGGVIKWGETYLTTNETEHQGRGLLHDALIDIWRMTR